MKIAVVRALQLGDLLCAVPALRALDAAYPRAAISLIGLPWAREFAARFSRYVDRFIEFPGFPGMPERSCSEDRLLAFVGAMQRERFDLVLQLHGDGSYMNSMVALMEGAHSAGFHPQHGECPDTDSYLAWRPRENEVLRNLRLLEHLGIPAKGTQLEFPLTEGDRRDAAALAPAGEFAIVHPGSQLASRRWPVERFAELADALADDGLQIVLTGTAGEQPLIERMKDRMRAPAVDLCGHTTLGGLGALIARARVLVANDTGVSHIAAATCTPSVIVACGSDPLRWAPLDRERHRVLHHDIGCRPCAYRECPIGHPCALGVSVAQALDAVRDLVPCAA
jgi:ADP-heptose:LPS heptosyltransferase